MRLKPPFFSDLQPLGQELVIADEKHTKPVMGLLLYFAFLTNVFLALAAQKRFDYRRALILWLFVGITFALLVWGLASAWGQVVAYLIYGDYAISTEAYDSSILFQDGIACWSVTGLLGVVSRVCSEFISDRTKRIALDLLKFGGILVVGGIS